MKKLSHRVVTTQLHFFRSFSCAFCMLSLHFSQIHVVYNLSHSSNVIRYFIINLFIFYCTILKYCFFIFFVFSSFQNSQLFAFYHCLPSIFDLQLLIEIIDMAFHRWKLYSKFFADFCITHSSPNILQNNGFHHG